MLRGEPKEGRGLRCGRQPPPASLQLHKGERDVRHRLADLLGQLDGGVPGNGGRDAGWQVQIRPAIVHARRVCNKSLQGNSLQELAKPNRSCQVRFSRWRLPTTLTFYRRAQLRLKHPFGTVPAADIDGC